MKLVGLASSSPTSAAITDSNVVDQVTRNVILDECRDEDCIITDINEMKDVHLNLEPRLYQKDNYGATAPRFSIESDASDAAG